MLAVHFPGVYSALYTARPALRPALHQPIADGWTPLHHLVEKQPGFLLEILTKLPLDDAQQALMLTNAKKSNLSVAHFLASLRSTIMRQLLLAVPGLRTALLAHADASGSSVYHVLGQSPSAALRDLLLGIMQVRHCRQLPTGSLSLTHFLSRTHFFTLFLLHSLSFFPALSLALSHSRSRATCVFVPVC